ncbi:metalloprotease m41 ftsh [Holotrichia oblita]|nr:metalloprotease m41 ftsh [Holotrichia oblita]
MRENKLFSSNIFGAVIITLIAFLLLFAILSDRNNNNKSEVTEETAVTAKSDISWLEIGGSVILFGGAFFIASKMLNRQKNNAAMSNTFQLAKEENFINFDMVAGNEEAKDSVTDIVDFLRNPEKYGEYGARIPRGVIFYGSPGTGKTLLAKALAGEAKVPFFAVSGSDFVQISKKLGKAVIFIDEIDALGKKRAVSPMSGNDERDQTLNALLTEMSGFNENSGIIIIAATNRLDTLDEALLRPGRAYYTIIAGTEKKDRSRRSERDKKITAYHEAGHALVTKLASPENSVLKVTIIPSSRGAGGFSVNIPKDKMFYTKAEIRAQMMIALAGRAAEELVFGADYITTGASNDIEKASSMCKDYVSKYGMCEDFGLISMNVFSLEKETYNKCKEILGMLYSEILELLSGNMKSLSKIANELIEKESLSEKELDKIIKSCIL